MTSPADAAKASPASPAAQIASRAVAPSGSATRGPARSFLRSSLHRFVADRLSMVALGIFVVILFVTITAPFIASQILHTSPEEFLRTPEGRIAILQPPGPDYLLGTDEVGRDNLTRLLYAGQV